MTSRFRRSASTIEQVFDGSYIPIPEPEGRITEFMRWRLGTGTDVPGHATYYRVFGGGWATVLAAYRETRAEAA